MVLFSFYVEIFVENACVCIRLIGPTYLVVLFIWLFAVFTVIYAVRLIIAFVDVNKTYLILSYLPDCVWRVWVVSKQRTFVKSLYTASDDTAELSFLLK